MNPNELKKIYCGAVAADIINILNKRDTIGIFEFRRIEKISALTTRLLNSVGTPDARYGHSEAMRKFETLAPTLYTVLENQAFDGNALLKEKYEEVQAVHTRLKGAQLDLEAAQSLLRIQEAERGQHMLLLREQETHIERERERLELAADRIGKDIELPDMPQLPANFGGSEVEDEEYEKDQKDQDEERRRRRTVLSPPKDRGAEELDSHIDEEWGQENG